MSLPPPFPSAAAHVSLLQGHLLRCHPFSKQVEQGVQLLDEWSEPELASPVEEAWAPGGFHRQALKVVRSPARGRVTVSGASALPEDGVWADGAVPGRSLVDWAARSRPVAV